jgi:quinoprotein glucose dehydrogenase
MRQVFNESDINPLLHDTSYQSIKKQLSGYKTDHIFNPPSLEGTVMFPGLDGGAEWGGPSFDPETGILYINANEMAWLITAKKIDTTAIGPKTYGEAGAALYQANCMSCHGAEKKGSGNNPTLIGAGRKYSLASFDTLLQSGRRMMPAFKQLDTEERKAIAAYVMDQQVLKEKTFPKRDAVNDHPVSLPYSITGYHKFLTSDGLPAVAPPWGTLNALDLNTGEYTWKKTLGHDKRFPVENGPTGTENYGAGVVTRGGLIFIAATTDGKLRAFNKRTGDLIWEADLPFPAFATPAIYEMQGRQYIVIACGGGKINTPSGDIYIAYALPETK